MNDTVYTGLSSRLSAGQGQTEIGYINVARTISPKQGCPYPLKQNNDRGGTRLPSTSSRITLLRSVSDVSSFHRSLSRSTSIGLGQLH